MVYEPTNPMFFHLLNFNDDHVIQIRWSMQWLLTYTPTFTYETTMSLEVFSPFWVAFKATNRLKQRHPDKYVNNIQYDIQSAQLILGQNPPPLPQALLKVLAEFGLK
jgi:hypothetical protein